MEWLSLLLLLLVSTATSLSGRSPLIPLSLFFALLAVLLLRTARERGRSDLLNQIRSYRRELRQGGSVIINGKLITAATVLTTYSVTVGGVVCNINLPSAYYSKKDPSEAVLYSCLSLITGWFSIPSGPMLTLLSISTNLLGGEELPVADLVGAKESQRPSPPRELPSEPNTLLLLLIALLPEQKKKEEAPEHPSKLREQLEEMKRRKTAQNQSPPQTPGHPAQHRGQPPGPAPQNKQRFPR